MRRGVGSDDRGGGAAAPFSRGKIDNFFFFGGGGITFIFQPGGQIQTLRPVASAENMKIKHRMEGFGLKWPGDGVAASLLGGGIRCILGILGGR